MGKHHKPTPNDDGAPDGFGDMHARLSRLGVEPDLALALIEGDLGELESQRVRAMLMQDEKLAGLMGRMAQDRAALTSLGAEVRVPRDMRRPIAARIERESLLGMEMAAEGALAESKVSVSQRGAIGKLADKMGAQGVLAASIVLVIGLGIVGFGGLISQVWNQRDPIAQRPDDPGPTVAQTDPNAGTGATDPETDTPDADSNTNLAGADPSTPEVIDPIDPSPIDVAVATPVEDIDALTAVELLSQGRLAIRLRSAESWRATASVESKLADARIERVSDARASALASELRGALQRDAADRVNDAPNAPFNVDDLMQSVGEVVAVYGVEVALDEGSLERLAAVLTTGPDQVAEFVRLDRPVPTTLGVDAESVIWWGYGPSRWTARASLPILVEQTPIPDR